MQGGAEQSVKLLAEGLVSRGHDVAVWCIDQKSKEGPSLSAEVIGGVTVYRTDAGRFDLWRFCYQKERTSKVWKISQKARCYFNLALKTTFDDICDNFVPDVVHTNSMNGIPTSIWRCAHRRGLSVVHTIRDTAPISPYAYGHMENPLVVKAHRCLYKENSRLVDAVTAPSGYTLRMSLETGSFAGSKMSRRVYNCVRFDREALNQVIANKTMRESGPIRFMYAGRLLESKGVRHMLRAFSRLDGDVELHICGGGELQSLVEDHVAADSRVIYHGSLTSAELNEVYALCDVLLVPSCWPEPFGRVVIEGNLHAMPVLACRVGGIPEILEVTCGGVTYAEGSEDELLTLMEAHRNREKIRSYFDGITKGIETFSLDRQLSEFEAIYRTTAREE